MCKRRRETENPILSSTQEFMSQHLTKIILVTLNPDATSFLNVSDSGFPC